MNGWVDHGNRTGVHRVSHFLRCPYNDRVYWSCGCSGRLSLFREDATNPVDCRHCLGVIESERLGHIQGSQSLYFAEADGLIKIGISTQPAVRVRSLRADLLAIESAPDGWRSERAAHRRFADLRVRGEWFRPGSELVGHIHALLSGAA